MDFIKNVVTIRYIFGKFKITSKRKNSKLDTLKAEDKQQIQRKYLQHIYYS